MNHAAIIVATGYQSVDTRRRTALPIFFYILFSLCLYSHPAHSATYLLDEAYQDCPTIAGQERYQVVLQRYGARMRDPYTSYGCDVVPLYYAFEGAETVMDVLEEDGNGELVRTLLALIKEKPALEEALHENNKLSFAFGLTAADDQEAARRTLEALASLEKTGERDSAYASLILLIPGAPPLDELKKQMPPKETELVLAALQLTALTSDGEYESFLSDTPRDTLAAYQMFVKAWGEVDLQRVLRQTPDAVASLKPPMRWSNLSDLTPPDRYSPDSFQVMQKVYVETQRDIYRQVREKYGPAWAAETADAFSLPLAMNLVGVTPEKAADIKVFLVWLTTQSRVFPDIVRQSACSANGRNNLQILAWLMSRSSPDSLKELAQWYKNGNLDDLLHAWVKSSSPNNFQQAFVQQETDAAENSLNADQLFWGNILELAHLRTNLVSDSQKLLDDLIFALQKPEDQLWVSMLFMNQVVKTSPFFSIMENGRFSEPIGVALRLLDYGYPDSSEPSLFARFRRGEPIDMAAFAIQERGSQPEAKIMTAGRTFKDMTGIDPEVVLIAMDVAELVTDIGITIASAGTATPATGAHAAILAGRLMTRIGLRQVAKSTLRLGVRWGSKEAAGMFAKNIAKSAVSHGKILQTAKDGGKLFLRFVDRASQVTSIYQIGCAAAGGCGSSTIHDYIGADYKDICPEQQPESAQ